MRVGRVGGWSCSGDGGRMDGMADEVHFCLGVGGPEVDGEDEEGCVDVAGREIL